MLSRLRYVSLVCSMCAAVCMLRGASADDPSLAELQRRVESLQHQANPPLGGPNQRAIDRARKEAGQRFDDVLRAPHSAPTGAAREIPRTHVKADGGEPFPKPEEVVIGPGPTFAIPQLPPSTKVEPPRYRRPTSCDVSTTNRVEIKTRIETKEERILIDTLYLPEHLVPMDPSEVFGVRTQLYPYSPQLGEGVLLRMQSDAVPCYPYRIRITNLAVYYDSGNNALKNYDKQQSGRGVYHAWIQQKLFGGK